METSHSAPREVYIILDGYARSEVMRELFDFDNTALLLRPGMTATADIVTKTLTGTLRIPNAALRFKPPELVDTSMPADDPSSRTVWVLADGSATPTAARVRIGDSDGHNTELADDSLPVGARVIVDVVTQTTPVRTGLFPRAPH